MTVQAPAQGGRARPWWPWLKRGITVGFFSLVAYLLVVNAREIEWSEVGAALRKRPLDSLLFAALVAALSHAVYSCYDLLSRRYTGHHLSTGQVLSTTFISYAFNLNLGSLVGALGFRHRLYSRLGLRSGEINRIIAFSMLTNWIGYLLLAGIAFLMRPLDIPQDWALGSGALQVVGGLLLCVVAAYLLSCAFSRQRSWRLRGHEIELPPVRMALLQLAISSTNWLLIAAVAGVLTHVPAGLGVLEAVFVALLSRQVPTNELLAALLAYRGIYYLAPLMAATALYLFLEAKISTDSG